MTELKGQSPLNDSERLAELARSKLMYSSPEEGYDRLSRLVRKALNVPVGLVSLVSDECQFFKSQVGLPEPWASSRQTPLSHSFCQYVVTTTETLRVEDARLDPRLSGNLAIRDLCVIAYLGVPVRTRSGHVLGSLCAIDSQPRKWTEDDEQALYDIASIVEDQIALDQDEKYWRQILNTVPQIVWSTLPDGFHDFYNNRWYEFTGVPRGSTDGEGWNGMFHPDDQQRAWELWRRSLKTGEPYEIEYRLRDHSGRYRWTLGRALPIRNAAGKIERWFGTCTDIDDLKQAEAARAVIEKELAHRIQNIFALVKRLITAASRRAPASEDFAASLAARVQALASAYRYVSSSRSSASSGDIGPDRTLHELIRTVVAPYQSADGSHPVTVDLH